MIHVDSARYHFNRRNSINIILFALLIYSEPKVNITKRIIKTMVIRYSFRLAKNNKYVYNIKCDPSIVYVSTSV